MVNNYSAWGIDPKKFPANGTIKAKIAFILRYGILAPSTHNSQPWDIKFIADNKIQIIIKNEKKLPFADPSGRGLAISIGTFLQNIILASRALQVECSSYRYSSAKSSLTIEFQAKPKATTNGDAVLDAIVARCSNKRAYTSAPIPDSILTATSKLAIQNNATITYIKGDKDLNAIADLYQASALRFARSNGFIKELKAWMRPNKTSHYDGMPGFVLGLNSLQDRIGRILLGRVQSFNDLTAKKYHPLIKHGPILGVLCTRADNHQAWLSAGIAYEDAAVHFASKGVSTTLLAAIIEDKNGRNSLAKKLGTKLYPQIFFRAGYPYYVGQHTPRKPLEVCIIEE